MATLETLPVLSDQAYPSPENFHGFAPRYSQTIPKSAMGSVGSGVANDQEFAMKSVGTRMQSSGRQTEGPRNGYSTREISNRYSGEEKTYKSEKVSNSLYINGDLRKSEKVKMDICGNVTTNNEKNLPPPPQYREPSNPPKILPISGKLDQVRTSWSSWVAVAHLWKHKPGGLGQRCNPDGLILTLYIFM